jgi:hypothetical protein
MFDNWVWPVALICAGGVLAAIIGVLVVKLITLGAS